MAKYLYMDGVDDLLRTNPLPFNRYELDVKPILKTGILQHYVSIHNYWDVNFSRNSSNVDIAESKIKAIRVNGSIQTRGTAFIKSGERCIISVEVEYSPNFVPTFLGHLTSGTGFMEGELYGIKLYNGTTLVAHYDMSTGTVLDQSGNGNHAILVGGTWKDHTPKYLYMDGIDDQLRFGSTATFKELTEFEAEFLIEERKDWHQVFNLGNKIVNFQSNTLNINIHADFQDVFVDGVKVTSGTPFLTIGTKHVMKGVLKSGINTGTNGSYMFTNTISQFLKGSIYNVKLFKNGILEAHYDMSTGTVLDQSGNGNHATLIGGTWIDDGGGEEPPIGIEGIENFNLSQQLFNTSDARKDMRQSIYNTSNVLFDTLFKKYLTSVNLNSTKQSIYNTAYYEYGTNQMIYRVGNVLFDTLIYLFDGGITGSVNFNTKLQLYYERSNLLNLRQQMYNASSSSIDMKQLMYELSKIERNLKQIIYSASKNALHSKQVIYKEDMVDNPSVQQTYNTDSQTIDMLSQIYSQSNIKMDTKQIVYMLSHIENEMRQQLYKIDKVEYSTLQEMLSDFTVYRQVFEYLMKINMSSDYELDVVTNKKYDLSIAGSKSYKTKI